MQVRSGVHPGIVASANGLARMLVMTLAVAFMAAERSLVTLSPSPPAPSPQIPNGAFQNHGVPVGVSAVLIHQNDFNGTGIGKRNGVTNGRGLLGDEMQLPSIYQERLSNNSHMGIGSWMEMDFTKRMMRFRSVPISGTNANALYAIVVNFHWRKFSVLNHFVKDYLLRFQKLFKHDFDVFLLAPPPRIGSKSIGEADKALGATAADTIVLDTSSIDPFGHVPYNFTSGNAFFETPLLCELVTGNGLPEAGHYSYHSLAVAHEMVSQWQEQEGLNRTGLHNGFVFMNDDSYVDPLFLNEHMLDQSFHEPLENPKRNDVSWWVWNKKNNTQGVTFLEAYKNALAEISNNTFLRDACQLEAMRRRNDSVSYKRGFSDFFYVAAKDMPLFLSLERIMFKHRVFLEQAVATINECLSNRTIVNCNHRKMPDRGACLHMHPLKYSRPEDRAIMLNRITRRRMDERPNTWR